MNLQYKAKVTSALINLVFHSHLLFRLVDASQAGTGTLEISVTTAADNVPNFVTSLGNGCYDVSFTPQVLENHSVHVRFNGEHVPGSPFTVDLQGRDVISPADRGIICVPVEQPAFLTIDPRHTDTHDVLNQMVVDVTCKYQ